MKTKITNIKPNPRNPRLIKDERFDKLCTSLREFPEMLEKRPLVCFTDNDGKFVVLGGNMRLKAAKEIGLKELPIVLADDWTAEQKDQFLIKDNLNFGEFNFDELQADWDVEQLEAWGLEHDWEKEQQLEAVEDDFDATPPEDPITVLGDLYEIGEHRLLCGDSTDSEQVAKLMNGEKAELLLTDPPYGIGIDGQKESKAKNPKHNRKAHEFRDWDNERPDINTFNLILSFADIAIIWGGNYFADMLPASRGWIYWSKGQDGLTMSDGELAWTTQDKPLRAITVNRAALQGSVHPTQKPIEVMSFCIKWADLPNIILDTYLGSGSTMVAAHQLKRKCYGMELDCRYADVIVNRMLKLDPTLSVKRNGVDCKNEFLNS